ncbi:MAG: MAPEG family protein [Rhizobiaceae bacterium]
MNGEAIFWPMLVQAFLTFGIYILVSYRRVSSVRAGLARPADFRVPSIEPAPSATAARSLINQFELPVLFYGACLVLFVLGAAGQIAVFTAWLFALSRVIHALVHVTSNRLRFRRPLFIIGFFSAFALWILIATRLAGLS